VSPELEQVVHVLQAAAGPAILVSGTGLLLLTMTNRFGRVIDRSRAIARESRTPEARPRDALRAEALVLLRRALLLRGAITLSATSVLFVALTVTFTFFAALQGLRVEAWILGSFALALGCLVAGMMLFIADVALSLRALRLEIDPLIAP
jgi:hypothetical protein